MSGTEQTTPPGKARAPRRIPALDWMRGVVILLMATDHGSGAFNANRLVTDAYFLYQPPVELPAFPFLYRWVSHLCAPTFLFLAGAGLALSVGRREDREVAGWTIDRDLLIRGLLILGVDIFFINWFWLPGTLLMQVMYAIGLSFVCMVPLRRLPTAWLVALGAAILAGYELILALNIQSGDSWLRFPIFVLLSGGPIGRVFVAYPVLPWLAMMLLGWGLGRLLHAGRQELAVRALALSGVAGLAVFAVFRGINGFGNMAVPRIDGSVVQWLHTSKYPPSLTFSASELGLMALILALLFVYQDWRGEKISDRNPVLVFGQTAFFAYVAHIFLLEVSARLLGVLHELGHAESLIAATLVMIALYPACLAYRGYKRRHPRSWLRFF